MKQKFTGISLIKIFYGAYHSSGRDKYSERRAFRKFDVNKITIFRSNLFKNQWQQASVQGQTKKNHNEEKENVTSHFSYCSRIREPNDAVDITYS